MSNFRVLDNAFLSPLPHPMWKITFFSKIRKHRTRLHCRLGISFMLLIADNIHRNAAVLEFLFNKVAGLKACNLIKKRH